MIWHEQSLDLTDGSSLRVVGIFNHPANLRPDQYIIQIILEDQNNNTKTLFGKNPSMMILPDEYMDPSIVKQKYIRQFDKCVQKIRRQVADKKLASELFL